MQDLLPQKAIACFFVIEIFLNLHHHHPDITTSLKKT